MVTNKCKIIENFNLKLQVEIKNYIPQHTEHFIIIQDGNNKYYRKDLLKSNKREGSGKMILWN